MINQLITKKESSNLKDNRQDTIQFRVSKMNENKCQLSSYNRRDFYKISLITKGTSRLLYANRDIIIDKPALVFTNPLTPYSWERYIPEMEYEGYFCAFTDDFLHDGSRMESLQESCLFKANGNPVYPLNSEQVNYLQNIFSRIRIESDSKYMYKNELIRNHVNLIIHGAIKMQPAVAYFNPPNAASRITKLFLGLLEKQFPIDSQQYTFKLKKAKDYAEQLSVHVNHLNAAVQEITGKTTTTHINEAIITEAKSLLLHTNWSVAEIAFSLGFEYASYFNNFFKKHTGITPLKIRITVK